jgi:hypothetical protein
MIGLVGLFAGVVLVSLSTSFVGTSGQFGSAIGQLTGVVGSVIVIFSLLWLLVGWGFATGKGWAWILGMIYTIISFLLAIGSLVFSPGGGIFGCIIWGLMLYYLTRPGVKAFFGKGYYPTTFPIASGYPTTGIPGSTVPGPTYITVNHSPVIVNPPPTGNTSSSVSQSSTSPTAVPPGTTVKAIVLNPLAKESSIPFDEATKKVSRTSGTEPTVRTTLTNCPRCGHKLGSGASYCTSCGTHV